MPDDILNQPRTVTEAIKMLLEQHAQNGESPSEVSDFMLLTELKECFGIEANGATVTIAKSKFTGSKPVAVQPKRTKAGKSSRFTCIESGLKTLARRAQREWGIDRADFVYLVQVILADWGKE
jgi:hypothetical protein